MIDLLPRKPFTPTGGTSRPDICPRTHTYRPIKNYSRWCILALHLSY